DCVDGRARHQEERWHPAANGRRSARKRDPSKSGPISVDRIPSPLGAKCIGGKRDRVLIREGETVGVTLCEVAWRRRKVRHLRPLARAEVQREHLGRLLPIGCWSLVRIGHDAATWTERN